MKILFDALGAPRNSGGMRLYVDGVIRGWLEAHPDDELTLLGGSWLSEEFGHSPNVRVVEWANEGAPKRIFGQFVLAAFWFMRTRSDFLISLSPVVSPLVPRRRRICTVQDWRHMKNPDEFGRAQLLYRKLWKASVARAGGVVTMSEKTQVETLHLVPQARSTIVETGRDYVRYWGEPNHEPLTDPRDTLVTFGHHSNKRPELVIGALAELGSARRKQINLVVLGARGEYKEELERQSSGLGVRENCTFPGFVDEAEYRSLIRRSSVVILASSDEGFGLPVAEANYLGIPALVTSDSGLESIHKQGIVVADPTPSSVAQALEIALRGNVNVPAAEGLVTWRDTATGIRAVASAVLYGS